MDSNLPPLPSGFTLDQGSLPSVTSGLPPLPAGFALDQQPTSSSAAPTGIRPTDSDLVNDALGAVDAGVSGVNQLVVGTGASALRTAARLAGIALNDPANRDWAIGKIDQLQNAITYHPQTQAGQQIGNAVSSAVSPVAGALSGLVGAVAGNQNVPAIMDGLAVLGLKAPVSGAFGTQAEGAAASLRAARTADQAAQEAGQGTLGLASGNPAIQAVEQRIASTPIIGEGLRDAIQTSNTKLGVSANEIVQNLAQGADTSAQSVGKALTDEATKAAGVARDQSSQMYQDIRGMLPEDASIPVSNTLKLLRSATRIDGAPATGNAIVPADIREIYTSLEKDAGLSGTLPYDAVQQVRTAVGQKIDWSPWATSSPSNGILKAAYASLSKDLNAGASSFGPDVAKAVQDANASYAKAAAQRQALSRVLESTGGPEKVYNSLFNTTKDGSTTLDAALKYSSPPMQRLLAASVLERMGKATAGAQDATGSVFSADNFLSNWNRMSPEARQSLFGSLPDNYAQSITQLVRNASALKSYGKVLSARAPVFQALGTLGTAGAVIEAAAHGIAGFKTLVATYGASKALGLALTNPQTAKALANISGNLADNATKYIARAYNAPSINRR